MDRQSHLEVEVLVFPLTGSNETHAEKGKKSFEKKNKANQNININMLDEDYLLWLTVESE